MYCKSNSLTVLFNKAIVVVFCTVFISSCSSLNNRAGRLVNANTDLTLTFEVSSDINPDEYKRPSPLFVRLYELKSPKLFNKTDFISLYERDKEVLGADFLARQELKRLKPGESRTERFKKLSEETQYVALFAEFLDYQNARYKVVIDITPNNFFDNKATIKISGNSLTVFK